MFFMERKDVPGGLFANGTTGVLLFGLHLLPIPCKCCLMCEGRYLWYTVIIVAMTVQSKVLHGNSFRCLARIELTLRITPTQCTGHSSS